MLVKPDKGGPITFSFFILILFGFPHEVPSQPVYQGLSKEDILEGLKKLYEERKDEVTPEEYTRTKKVLMESLSKVLSGKDITTQIILSDTILTLRQNLLFGKPCLDTPHDKSIMKPPILGDGVSNSQFRNYTKWRNRLLNSNQSFCAPLQGLVCSSSKTCQCRLNSVWNETSKKCGVPLGQNCPFERELVYLDIFKSSGAKYIHDLKTRSFNLKCLESYKCTYFPFFPAPICGKNSISEPGNEFEFGDISSVNSFLSYFESRETASLLYEEACDYSAFRNLASATQFEDPFKRYMTLKTLKDSKMLFCDFRYARLTCSQSNKCKCFHHMIYNNSTRQCDFSQDYSPCDDTHQNFIQIFKNVTIVEPIRYYLSEVFTADSTKCSPKRKDNICRFNTSDNPFYLYYERFCSCPDGKAGKNCDKKLTSLLPYIPTPSYANDVDLNEKMLLFDRMNDAAVLMETLLTQKEGESCDPNVPEIDIDGSIRVVRRLIKKYITMTKAQYETTIQRMNRVNEGYNGKKVICNMKDFGQLRCDPVKKICENRKFKLLYKEILEKLKDTSLKEGASCTRSIDTYEEISYKERFSDGDKDTFEHFRDIWVLGNVDYCAKDAKLICKKEDDADDYGKCASYEPKVDEIGKGDSNSGTVVPLTFYSGFLRGVIVLFTSVLF